MASPVHLTFLGGLGEIGRNCAAIEIEGSILLIDCGLMFPDDDMLGIDLVLPDFSWLIEHGDDVVGCVVTHGHEDHIGALSYLLREIEFPIFGTELSLGLARGRIEEAGLLKSTDLVAVGDNERRMIGPFDVEFIPATHSVPQGIAIAIHTPQGTILHTGDFKIDLTPVDRRLTNLSRVGALAEGDGIRLLLADSTNADQAGHSRSETSVGGVLYNLMHEQKGRRVITAGFASHVHRVQQLADAAIEFGRVIAPLGRSMQRNITMARELGLLRIPDTSLIDIEDVDRYEPGQVLVLSTGSQGEPMSALTLLASNENKWLKLTPDDTVILSSHPIPGNESAITKVIDNLFRQGAEVIHSGIADVHATGHAKAEELKLYHSLARPEYFVPVHGEYHHLVAHSRIATTMGTPASNVLIAEDGDRLRLDDDGLTKVGRVPADYVYVHGTVGDVGSTVLGERQILAGDGVVVVTLCVDRKNSRIVSGPSITTRGWIDEAEAADLLTKMGNRVTERVNEELASSAELKSIERAVRRAAGSFVSQSTRRRPMIVPIILES
ncbi:MAG: ribonuclease J [Microthrixaceae bacterium]|nr:ribonuclease J [Microthrixaceae bacterium]